MLDIINKIAAEERIDPDIINDAYRDCLKQIKDTLQRPDMPKVLINGFGSFKVKRKRINYCIKEDIKSYKMGFFTKGWIRDRLNLLFKVRKRLKNESISKEKRIKPSTD
jgi:nucleoid DNA-binding protein